MKFKVREFSWGYHYTFFCPGCGCYHGFLVRNDNCQPAWSFDGRSVNPSLLSQTGPIRCHLYIRDGNLQYLDDCTHDLKGQTVPMRDINETNFSNHI